MLAIAEFGSSVRKETDSYSDQDLLIVCDDHQKNELYKEYVDQGYSITTLSKKQLEFMQKSGALFIQHLKLESRMIFDEGGCLKRFLNSCDLVYPSNEEISLCERTIKKISMIPDSSITSNFKADFLYCVSRDYIIKRLAAKGYLAFGINDVREMASKVLGFDFDSFMYLLELRKIKSDYREGNETVGGEASAIDSWLYSLRDGFNIAIYDGCSFDAIFKIELEGAYEKLRILEYYYIVARSIGYAHVNHNMLMGYINKPNLYGSARRCNKNVIDSFIVDLREFLLNFSTDRSSQIASRNTGVVESGSKSKVEFKPPLIRINGVTH